MSSVIPAVLAAWNIAPSTSILTALVHSSSRANFGLCRWSQRNKNKER